MVLLNTSTTGSTAGSVVLPNANGSSNAVPVFVMIGDSTCLGLVGGHPDRQDSYIQPESYTSDVSGGAYSLNWGTANGSPLFRYWDQSMFRETASGNWNSSADPAGSKQGRVYIRPSTGADQIYQAGKVRPRTAKTGTPAWGAAGFVNGHGLTGFVGDRPYPASSPGNVPAPAFGNELYDPNPLFSFGYNLISGLTNGGPTAFKSSAGAFKAAHMVHLGVSGAHMQARSGDDPLRATSFNTSLAAASTGDIVSLYDTLHDMYLKPMSTAMDASTASSTQGYLAGIITFLGSFDGVNSRNNAEDWRDDQQAGDGLIYPERLGSNLVALTNAIRDAMGCTNVPVIHVNPLDNSSLEGEGSSFVAGYRRMALESVAAVCRDDPYRTTLEVEPYNPGDPNNPKQEIGSDGIHMSATGCVRLGNRLANHYWNTFVDKGLSIDTISEIGAYRTV